MDLISDNMFFTHRLSLSSVSNSLTVCVSRSIFPTIPSLVFFLLCCISNNLWIISYSHVSPKLSIRVSPPIGLKRHPTFFFYPLWLGLMCYDLLQSISCYEYMVCWFLIFSYLLRLFKCSQM